jgi:hypothetical protein
VQRESLFQEGLWPLHLQRGLELLSLPCHSLGGRPASPGQVCQVACPLLAPPQAETCPTWQLPSTKLSGGQSRPSPTP